MAFLEGIDVIIQKYPFMDLWAMNCFLAIAAKTRHRVSRMPAPADLNIYTWALLCICSNSGDVISLTPEITTRINSRPKVALAVASAGYQARNVSVIAFTPNVTVQRTAHLVRRTLEPLVQSL